MTDHTPKQLIVLLQTLESVSKQFDNTLKKEKKALEASDTEQLLQLSSAKKELANQLEDNTKTTHVFLKNININKGVYGLSDFIKRMKTGDIQLQLSKLWLNIQKLTDSNKEQNSINGSIIELNRRYTQRSLDVLHGQTGNNSSSTYGADGQATKKKLSRTIFTA